MKSTIHWLSFYHNKRSLAVKVLMNFKESPKYFAPTFTSRLNFAFIFVVYLWHQKLRSVLLQMLSDFVRLEQWTSQVSLNVFEETDRIYLVHRLQREPAQVEMQLESKNWTGSGRGKNARVEDECKNRPAQWSTLFSLKMFVLHQHFLCSWRWFHMYGRYWLSFNAIRKIFTWNTNILF